MLTWSEFFADRSGVRLGDEWMDTTEGDIHSNIEGQAGYTVTDHISGDAIAVGVRYAGGKRMAIAGASSTSPVSANATSKLGARETAVLPMPSGPTRPAGG